VEEEPLSKALSPVRERERSSLLHPSPPLGERIT